MRRPLKQSESVTLDGSGNGTVQLAPDGPHEKWYPRTGHNKVTGTAPKPPDAKCFVYVGHKPTDKNFTDATASGSFGDSTDRLSGFVISRTDDPYIFAVFTGGEPGAQATFTVRGEKEVW